MILSGMWEKVIFLGYIEGNGEKTKQQLKKGKIVEIYA